MADEEIITLAGWDLGFITPGRPLHVLHVEPGAEIAAHGVCSNDLLVGIDGRGFDAIAKDDVAKTLQAASRLNFERTESVLETRDVVMDVHAPSLESVPAVAPAAEAPAAAAPPVVTASPTSSEPTSAPPAGVPSAAAPPEGVRLAVAPLAEASPAASLQAAAPQATSPPSMVPPVMAPPSGPPPTGAPQPRCPEASPAPPVARRPAPRGMALRTGMMVRLKGFETEAMNGLRGRLGRFSEKQGSWQVFLDSTSSAKAVRPQNLEMDPDGDKNMKDALPGLSPGTGPPPEEGAMDTSGDSTNAATRDEPMQEGLPLDHDGDAWVELLRDAYMRQLRSDNEYPEPPPYERANRFASNQIPVPEGMFPSHALRLQSQMLHRRVYGDALRPGRRRVPPPPRFGGGFYFPQGRML